MNIDGPRVRSWTSWTAEKVAKVIDYNEAIVIDSGFVWIFAGTK